MRVLIVEDDARFGPVMQRALRRLGYTADRGHAVDLATNGAECRAEVAKFPAPDAIFMDGNFPGGPGPMIVRELRARGYAGTIIMMSGDPKLNTEGIAAGADHMWERKETIAVHFAEILAGYDFTP